MLELSYGSNERKEIVILQIFTFYIYSTKHFLKIYFLQNCTIFELCSEKEKAKKILIMKLILGEKLKAKIFARKTNNNIVMHFLFCRKDHPDRNLSVKCQINSITSLRFLIACRLENHPNEYRKICNLLEFCDLLLYLNLTKIQSYSLTVWSGQSYSLTVWSGFSSSIFISCLSLN